MGQVNVIKRSFNAGQVTERLEDRSDLPKVQDGCRRAQNVLITIHGVAEKRGGFRMIAPVKDHTKPVRLISFRFSVDQAYVIEVGDGYMRYFKDGGQILDSDTEEIYEIVSPYTAAQIDSVQWAQSSDVLFLTHAGYPPCRLTRADHDDWTIVQLPIADGPYLVSNQDDAHTLTPSNTSGTVTITSNKALFTPNDVGRHIRLKHGSTWGWVKVSAYGSPTLVTATVRSVLGGTSAVTTWRLGCWYPTSYPPAVCLFQGRLWMAGAASDPTIIAGSEVQAYYNYALGTTATDAVEFKIEGEDQLAIQAIRPIGDTMMVCAASGLHAITSGEDDPSITYDAGDVSPQSTDGAEPGFMARLIGSEVVYVARGAQRLLAAGYRYDIDAYRPGELTTYSREITFPGIVDYAYQDIPERVIWVVRADGMLLSCTYNADQRVLAWAEHPTQGEVESVAVIPNDVRDELWIAVKRTINGQTRRFIERMEPPLDSGDAISDSFYVDCGLTYSGDATTDLSGLDHLAGETVAILADGFVLQQQTVSVDGTLTLPFAASTVHIGLPYSVLIEPTDPDVGARDGSTQGRRKRIIKVTLDLLRSSSCKIGASEDNLVMLSGAPQISVWGQPQALHTGELRSPFPGGWSYSMSMVVVQDLPLPFTIRSIAAYISVSEG